MKMAKSKNISEEINFQSYVDEVKHGNIHFYMFTTMIFREEISISRAFWSGKNHFCLEQPVKKSFPMSPEILFQECLFTFCM